MGEGGLDMGGLGGGAEGLADTGGPGPGAGGMPPGLAKKGGGPGQANQAAQSQSQTSSRPAQEAATFTEAFTQDTGGKVSTAPETLVMPKTAEPQPQLPPGQAKKTQERPAFRESTNNTPTAAEIPDAQEGFSAKDTESSRGSTRIFRMPDPPAGRNPGQGKGPETRKGPERSDFGSNSPSTGTRVAMRASQVKVPVRPVKDLIPPNLNKLANMESVAKRFGSDMALLQQQVRPSDVPSRDRALRAWAFFTAYAEAAAGKDGLKAALELFEKALKKEGFGEYRDGRTGKDAIKLALWVLEASTPEEALERALEADIEPMVALEVLLSEAAKTLKGEGKQKGEAALKPEAGKGEEASQKPDTAKAEETPKKPQEGRVSQPKQQPEVKPQETPRKEEGRVSQPKSQASSATDNTSTQGLENASPERADGPGEQPRMNPQAPNGQQPVLLPPQPELTKRRTIEEESLIGKFEESLKKMDKGMRLGSNMLWNALHQLRKGPGESAIEKEKWNQLAFAAMLSFVGLMLLVILVVAL